MTKTYSSPYPIVFVFDFKNENMRVPDYDESSVVSSNQTSVSVRTIADVDGSVTVLLGPALPNEATRRGFKVFDGTIQTPSGSLAVVTSENERLLEIEVRDTRARLEIAVDDLLHPSRVWIAAKGTQDGALRMQT